MLFDRVPGRLGIEVHGAGTLHVSDAGLAEIDELSSNLRAGVATIDLSFCLGAGRLGRRANAIFEYVAIFHNRQHRHSLLGMLTPVEYELRHASPTAA